jgi:hypothetical protein
LRLADPRSAIVKDLDSALCARRFHHPVLPEAGHATDVVGVVVGVAVAALTWYSRDRD